jgi:MHS family proline/betaine transporter-like MFS transporter
MAIAAVSTVVEWYDFTLYLYLVTVLARVFMAGAGLLLAALAGFAVSHLMRPLGARWLSGCWATVMDGAGP